MSVLNGQWWLPCVQHYCLGLSCCVQGKISCINRVIEALMKTVLSKAPGCPAVNKWSKLGPCVDILMSGIVLHQILPRAFALMKRRGADMQGKARGDDDDGDYVAALDFSALQGKRFSAALAMLQDRQAHAAIICLVIVLEPLRAVTAWFMRAASQTIDPCSRPPILDLLNLPYSRIVHARQYIYIYIYRHELRADLRV